MATNKNLLDRFRKQVRYFNKAFLNKVLGQLAGTVHVPFAMVFHQGRKTGKPYQTPIIVAPVDDGFIIALTYGPKVDWYRNILAAGRCRLLWHEQNIEIINIKPMDPKLAQPVLPFFERTFLSLLGVRDFAKMWRAN